ncbi:Protein-glutamate methylesterase/protein-glutamine glutaminase [Sporomusa silvacetica DSM 10669]|uniref:Protein-glutamate methylesterase/protein-glutamine glutaminase n=1 Tax=Sporomusa silvacetica DSM 10669 TaxID=1123289 RepID=A0ABZ3IPH0_9FIRM|nr:diguanylate cyclase [Sporomusa silvacetica]OZC19838.1 phytochrome-like protein cph2 [Sporomusa silvacetica DSM 10669]
MAILIVDDSADSRVLIKRFLEKHGFGKILTVENATDAFALLGLDQPEGLAKNIDLILMDGVMPGIDGIKACQLIKSHTCFKDVPIIIITANDNAETLDKAFAAGAIDFITKPIKQLELKARVNSVLNMKHAIDQRKAREAELVKVLEELESVNRELSRLSSLDGLTGIANRRHFDQIYELERQRAVRTGHDLSIVFFDIDFFKYYNDTYGHQEGDDCLKKVAAAAGSVLKRPGDLLARYGGEEFVVILPETGVAGAYKVAQDIRTSVEKGNIQHSASKLTDHITVSIGVAGGKMSLTDKPQELLTLADKALYEAKSGGRNQVRIAERYSD